MQFKVDRRSIFLRNPGIWVLLVWRCTDYYRSKRSSVKDVDGSTRIWNLGWVAIHFVTFQPAFGWRTRRFKKMIRRFRGEVL